MKKIPKSLILSFILLTTLAVANWQSDLWKGGIWSDGKNITVQGNVTVLDELSVTTATIQALSGDLSLGSNDLTTNEVNATTVTATNLSAAGYTLIGFGSVTVAAGDSGSTPTIAVTGAASGDFALATINGAGSTDAYIVEAAVGTDKVDLTLSDDPVAESTFFASVYRVID